MKYLWTKHEQQAGIASGGLPISPRGSISWSGRGYMNRTRFVLISALVLQHYSGILFLLSLSFFIAGCSKTDTQEYEPYSNLGLAKLDSAIAHFEVRVANGAHEQSLFDSLGEAYLRKVRIDQPQLPPYYGFDISTNRRVLLNAIFHNTEKAELLLHRAIDQDPNDLMAKKVLVEVLLVKLRAFESTLVDSGGAFPPASYQTINHAYQLAQSIIYSSKDSVLLWRPMADLYSLTDEFTMFEATYHDSAHVFIQLKLSNDPDDPIALFYSRFLEWRSYNSRLDRGHEARKLLRSNLTYPYVLAVIDESRSFYFSTGGMTTWLDRLQFVPKIVKFSYGQGFRVLKTSYSHEDKSLITDKIESAYQSYPDNEDVLQYLISDDIANGRTKKALEDFSQLFATNAETRVLIRSFPRRGFFKGTGPPDTVFVNRFLELVKEKYPDDPISDYAKAYTLYVTVTHGWAIPGLPYRGLTLPIPYLDSCLQKNEGFLPAYDLLLRICLSAESDPLARSALNKWNSPENILQKMATIAQRRGGVDLDRAFNSLVEYYMRQKQYEL